MELALAKEFIYKDISFDRVYVSNNLNKILNIAGNDLTDYNLFAVLDTPNGEKLFHIHKTKYDCILGRVFLHKKYYMDCQDSNNVYYI